jgi:formylglycine-generating enzyme required for sulfatase activity
MLLIAVGCGESESGETTEQATSANSEPPLNLNSLDMKFKNIPAGTFMMGSPQTEEDRGDSEHQHQVTITKAFYMQTTEVTQGQWKTVMGTEPWKGKFFVKEGPDYPVVHVTWNEAVAYCKKLSEAEGKTYR